MPNATTSSALKPVASSSPLQSLLLEMWKATPACIFATAVMAAFGKSTQR